MNDIDDLSSYSADDSDTIVVTLPPQRQKPLSILRPIQISDNSDEDDLSQQKSTELRLERLLEKYGRRNSRPARNKSKRFRDTTAQYDTDPEQIFWDSCLDTAFSSVTIEETESQGIKIEDIHIYEISDESKVPQSLHEVFEFNDEYQPQYVFDGTLRNRNGESVHLTNVAITRASVDNLRDPHRETGPTTSSAPIWIETKISAKHNDWYLIKSARPAYELHLSEFIWLAQFTKHFIDYLVWNANRNRQVHLRDLEGDFLKQVALWHSTDAVFSKWHDQCGQVTDFRRHFTCYNHTPFIAGQAWNIGHDEDDEIRSHPIWEEVGQPSERACDNEKPCAEQISVTAHAANCFVRSFPEWGPEGWNLLKVESAVPTVRAWQEVRRSTLALHDMRTESTSTTLNVLQVLSEAIKRPFRIVRPLDGDELSSRVVLVRLHTGTCSGRPCACKDLRYAYVHDTAGPYSSDIIISWLLTPSKTACVGRYAGRKSEKKATSFYPITNELFWDGGSRRVTIPTSDVLKSFSVDMNNNLQVESEIIIRRTYYHQDTSFHIPDNRRRIDRNDVYTERIRTLSIFSGCGLLDFGLEEGSGGLLQTIFTADINGEAVKSSQANHKHHEFCQFHREDVNALFREFCTGLRKLPEVDCLVGGCPCQGYSRLNVNKNTAKSQKNCALLAHTLSWVELLLPKMVVIENVISMDRYGKHPETPTAAGQAVCHLLSLGYQVKLVTINASDFGGATSRKRLFVIATIPSIPLPDLPQYDTQSTVSSKLATSDLNTIENNRSINILHPDHVPSEQLEPFIEELVALIPHDIPKNSKRMSNLSGALPFMNTKQQQFYEDCTEEQKSKASETLRRVHPDRPFGTITTSWVLFDSRGFPKVHWAQNRTLSLLELRRFHGVPDSYVLVGSLQSQLHQLGNSVAFATSVTIGKMLAKSWRKTRSVQSPYSNTAITPRVPSLPLAIPDLTTRRTTNPGKRPSPSKLQIRNESETDDDSSDGDAIIVKRPRLYRTAQSTHEMNNSPRTNSESRSSGLADRTIPPGPRFNVNAGRPLVLLPALRSSISTATPSTPKIGSTQETAIVIDDD